MAAPAPPSSTTPSLAQRLQGLSAYASQLSQVAGDLERIAIDAASLFAAEACSIMLFKDGRHGGPGGLRLCARSRPLPPGVEEEAQSLDEGLASKVASAGQALLVPDLAGSEFAALGRREGGSCICAPIQVAGHVLGVLNLSRPEPFTEDDLALACGAAQMLGLGLELSRFHFLLRSRFAHRAIAEELVEHPAQDAARLGADPVRMARILGRTFFRELRASGYGSDHILTAATEVIGELGRDIGKGKAPRKGR